MTDLTQQCQIDALRRERDALAAQVAGRHVEIDRILDLVVRAKMMEPPPPIVIQGSPEMLAAITEAWKSEPILVVPEENLDRALARVRELEEGLGAVLARLGPGGYIPSCGEPVTRRAQALLAKKDDTK
jgi:hypothetical protein